MGLVEFALVFPLIVLLLFGLIDLGRAVFAYSTLANAVRQGARVAIVNQLDVPSATTCNLDMPIEDVANPRWQAKPCTAAAAVSLGIRASDVTITYSAPPGSSLVCPATPQRPTSVLVPGCIATVTATYPWQALTPVVSSIVGPITFTATSTMPVEMVFP